MSGEQLTGVPTYCPHGPLGGVARELRDGSDCRWDYGGRSKAVEYLETHLRVVHGGVDPRPGAVQLRPRPKVLRAIVARQVRPVEEPQAPGAAGTARDDGSGTVEGTASNGPPVEATDAVAATSDVDGPGSTLSEPGGHVAPAGCDEVAPPGDQVAPVNPSGPGSLSATSFLLRDGIERSIASLMDKRPRSRVERGIEPWTDDEIDNAFRYFHAERGRWPLPADAKTTDYLPARTSNHRWSYQTVWRRLGAGDIPVGRGASNYIKSGKPHAPWLATEARTQPVETVASAGATLIAAARTFLDTLERQLAA